MPFLFHQILLNPPAVFSRYLASAVFKTYLIQQNPFYASQTDDVLYNAILRVLRFICLKLSSRTKYSENYEKHYCTSTLVERVAMR